MADDRLAKKDIYLSGYRFEFDLFGCFSVRTSDGMMVTPRGRKARALLAHLIVEHKPVSRERLSSLLWSCRGQAQAYSSLRQCLYELKPFRSGPDPLLTIDRYSTAVTGPVDVDVDRMLVLASAGEVEVLAEALSRGETLLEDLDGLDPEMDRWLRGIRATRGEALIAAAQEACRTALDFGDGEGAFALARQLQRIDPLDEGAARLVMESAQAAGHTGSEHRAFEQLRHDLQEELGVEPAAETRVLHDRLKLRESGIPFPPAAATAPFSIDPAESDPSLASSSRRSDLQAAPRVRHRFYRAFAALLLPILLSASAFTVNGSLPATVPAVSVRAEPDPASLEMSRDVSIDLARLASEHAWDLSFLESESGAAPDYVIEVGVKRSADRLRVNLSLLESNRPELLWASAIDRPIETARNARQEVTSRIGDILFCAIKALNRESGLSRDTTKLFIMACDRSRDDESDDRQIELLRQVTRQAPHFALGWAHLAVAEAEMRDALVQYLDHDAPQRRALRDSAYRHLELARRLDPSLGATYLAQAELSEPGQWARRLAILDAGLAVDPGNAALHGKRARALSAVGRMRHGTNSAARAADLDPFSPAHRSQLISSLAYSGNVDEARKQLEEAERIWPESTLLREARSRFDLRYGDPFAALRATEEVDLRIPGYAGIWRGPAGQAFARARNDPTPDNIENSLRWFRRAYKGGLSIMPLLQSLVLFGRIEEAFRLVEDPDTIAPLRYSTEVLFRSQMVGLMRDPRFMRLAARIGLVDYWRSTGFWPDFCSDPDLPYDCRRVANALSRTAARGEGQPLSRSGDRLRR